MSDLAQNLNIARQRVLAGEVLSLEEQRNLLKAVRGQRVSAAEPAAKAKSKSATKARGGISDEQLDNDLDAALGL